MQRYVAVQPDGPWHAEAEAGPGRKRHHRRHWASRLLQRPQQLRISPDPYFGSRRLSPADSAVRRQQQGELEHHHQQVVVAGPQTRT